MASASSEKTSSASSVACDATAFAMLQIESVPTPPPFQHCVQHLTMRAHGFDLMLRERRASGSHRRNKPADERYVFQRLMYKVMPFFLCRSPITEREEPDLPCVSECAVLLRGALETQQICRRMGLLEDLTPQQKKDSEYRPVTRRRKNKHRILRVPLKVVEDCDAVHKTTACPQSETRHSVSSVPTQVALCCEDEDLRHAVTVLSSARFGFSHMKLPLIRFRGSRLVFRTLFLACSKVKKRSQLSSLFAPIEQALIQMASERMDSLVSAAATTTLNVEPQETSSERKRTDALVSAAANPLSVHILLYHWCAVMMHVARLGGLFMAYPATLDRIIRRSQEFLALIIPRMPIDKAQPSSPAHHFNRVKTSDADAVTINEFIRPLAMEIRRLGMKPESSTAERQTAIALLSALELPTPGHDRPQFIAPRFFLPFSTFHHRDNGSSKKGLRTDDIDRTLHSLAVAPSTVTTRRVDPMTVEEMSRPTTGQQQQQLPFCYVFHAQDIMLRMIPHRKVQRLSSSLTRIGKLSRSGQAVVVTAVASLIRNTRAHRHLFTSSTVNARTSFPYWHRNSSRGHDSERRAIAVLLLSHLPRLILQQPSPTTEEVERRTKKNTCDKIIVNRLLDDDFKDHMSLLFASLLDLLFADDEHPLPSPNRRKRLIDLLRSTPHERDAWCSSIDGQQSRQWIGVGFKADRFVQALDQMTGRVLALWDRLGSDEEGLMRQRLAERLAHFKREFSSLVSPTQNDDNE